MGVRVSLPPWVLKGEVVMLSLLLWVSLASTPGKAQGVDISRCASCHRAVWDIWQNSLHAQSLSDPVFQGVLKDTPEALQATCMTCHDPRGEGKGITCAVCHESVSWEGNRFRWEKGLLHGPFAPTSDTLPHPVQVNPSMARAEFCATCHQYTNARGLAVFNTYQEWKQGPYAVEGSQCQNCHMPENPLRSPVDPPYQTRLTLTDHSFLGGHTVSQVRKTLSVTVFPPRDSAGRTIFRVDVANREAGHAVPTGLPTRRLRVLFLLTGSDGKEVYRDSVILQRVIVDAEGKRLSRFVDILERGVRVVEDGRIPPRGVRHLAFQIPDGLTRKAQFAEARIYYDFGDLPMPEGMKQLVLVTAERLDLSPFQRSLWMMLFWGLLGLGILFLLLGWMKRRRKEANP